MPCFFGSSVVASDPVHGREQTSIPRDSEPLSPSIRKCSRSFMNYGRCRSTHLFITGRMTLIAERRGSQRVKSGRAWVPISLRR